MEEKEDNPFEIAEEVQQKDKQLALTNEELAQIASLKSKRLNAM